MLNQLERSYDQLPKDHPAICAISSRRAFRFRVDETTIRHAASTDGERQLLAELPMKRGLSVPLVGRARMLGVITFFRFADVEFDDRDVAFAEEIARRIALAVDNALLHQSTKEAVQARNDLLAIVSHDLKNPLSGIAVTAALLQRIGSDEQRLFADRITRGSNNMMRLIDDLLDASKMESGKLTIDAKPERIGALISDALDSFRDQATEKAITLAADVEPLPSYALCDRQRIIQALSNLLGNALKFTPAGGVITVSARRFGDELRICVSDTGPGIPERDRGHIFDRYWQASHARRAGAGLGLFIVKGIVEAHGGRIWAETAPGGGASLVFTLRACPAVEEQPSPSTP